MNKIVIWYGCYLVHVFLRSISIYPFGIMGYYYLNTKILAFHPYWTYPWMLTLTLTITFPRTKTLTLNRTLTLTRIWINSNVQWISIMYDSVALCTVRQLILESLNHRIFHSIFVYVSLSTLSMIQQVTLHSRLL